MASIIHDNPGTSGDSENRENYWFARHDQSIIFLIIILGATDVRAPQSFAPVAIGLGLTLIHLIGIPVTNLSVNPARSTGPALFVGGWAIEQLWLFWLAPIVGAALAGFAYAMFREVEPEPLAARAQAAR